MIAASEPQAYVPFGRQQLLHHPKIVATPDQNVHNENTLLNRFSQVAISDSCKNKESWILRRTELDGVECEEELYYKDKTVIWSIGPSSVDNRTNRELKTCYTSDTTVQEALWCNFHRATPDFPATFFSIAPHKPPRPIPNDPKDEEHLKNCISILNSTVIKTFSQTGREYVTSLQFLVQKIWPTKYGLLLERKVNKETPPPPQMKKKSTATDLRRQSIEQSFLQKGSFTGAHFPSFHGPDLFTTSPEPASNDLPTLFSLSHPLDEICPVAAKNELSMYVSNPDLKVIFTSESPSLCLCLDRKNGLHGIYLVRRAQVHEAEACCRRERRPSRRNSYTSVGKMPSSGNSSFNVDSENRSIPAFLSTRTRKSLGLAASSFGNIPSSPMNTFEVRTSSPLSSRPYTSISPFGLSPASRKGESLHSSFVGTPSRIEHRMMSEDVEYAEAKPLFPQICLQCVWLEVPVETKGGDHLFEASKAFLSSDMLDQKYFCYLVGIKLNLLKIEVKSDEDFKFHGSAGFLQAKDACSLGSRNMIAIIGLDGGVDLYSGIVHVAKILISGVSSSVATPSYLSDFNAGPTFFSKPSPGTFPKRSSLLPQPQPMESPIFNETLAQLSPVTSCSSLSPTLPTEREGSLVAIKDNVDGRISLEYSSALIFRLELPNFGNSPLVQSLLTVLQNVLPANIALQFLIKWYTTRNAPGCYNICLQEEFRMFSNLLYGLLGYDLEVLQGVHAENQDSPVTRPKKLRTSELQSDEDWAALVGSQHHVMEGRRHSPFQLSALRLRPKDIPISPRIMETPMVSSGSRSSQPGPTSTPVLSEKTRRGSGSKKEMQESIDETPIIQHSKTFFKRIPSSRFQKTLNKGPAKDAEDTFRSKPTTALRNKKSLLYPHIDKILFSLHLFYEDLKLNTLRAEDLEMLAPILHQLARDTGCEAYVHHYWRDYPSKCPLVTVPRPPIPFHTDQFLNTPVPSIFQHLNEILRKRRNLSPYPYLPGVNQLSKNITQVFRLMSFENEAEILTNEDNEKDINMDKNPTGIPEHRVLLYMTELGITTDTLQTMPPGVVLTLYEVLYRCRDNPAPNWTYQAYKLIGRLDMASLYRSNSDEQIDTTLDPSSKVSAQPKPEDDDGMEELLEMDSVKLRWAHDQRVIDVRRMLRSASPVRIAILQRPEVTDHEFQQEQERHLYAICARTMALPVARGMVTLGCAKPVTTEKLPIPQLCLTGRVPPADKLVEMTHIDIPANMNDWPLFHNGVAAGLRVACSATDIDSKWIIFNKPKNNTDELIEHGGFLMALGLNGHLKDLVDITIFMYLLKAHEMMKVGLLLGIAVSKRGTMDLHSLKMVSVHIEAMLPPTGIDLDLDVIVEPAALMALGFLYQGTTHKHISQVLLHEIGRPPGPEMENSVDRESYSLAAGLALGLVAFGQANSLCLSDMTIPDTLHYLMVGGPKRPYLGSQRDKYKTPSFLIFEGALVNTHVTGPGATLALGMIYFNTGNKAVVEWLKIPETQHLLETVLPDALLLRILAKSLILWDDIDPSQEWVLDHVPEYVRPHCLVKPSDADDASSIDYETMNQAYCNIIAGACMAIGLRFAGSANEDAFETLSYYATKFTLLLGKSIAELCGRATMETCLNVITVSLGMVMAGTGNIGVMRLCRYLRSRVGPSNSVVTYGSHLATHMALGLLYLGGGTLTLSTSRDAIAALICAFYPKWPVCSSDNRYHLQALRHLYVLAVEPRLLLPRDIDTRAMCYAHVTYVYLDSSIYRGKSVRLVAPCLLPELNLLKEVRIEDSRYWSIKFSVDDNWEKLKNMLANKNVVDVERKAGCLSYLDDPQAFHSLLAQTLTSDEVIPWGVKPPSIYMNSSNRLLKNCLNLFFVLKPSLSEGEVERKTSSAISDFTYFCLTKDKLFLLPLWLSLIRLLQKLSTNPDVNSIWQWKLVFSQSECSKYKLIPSDLALSVKQDIQNLFTGWEPGVMVQIKNYLLGNSQVQGLDDGRAASYLTYHEIPYSGSIDFGPILLGGIGIPSLLSSLSASGMSASSILAILSLTQV